MNIGFDIAQRRDFDCIFFSDSDLMPMDDRVPLKCIEKPRHFSIRFESHFKFFLFFWNLTKFRPSSINTRNQQQICFFLFNSLISNFDKNHILKILNRIFWLGLILIISNYFTTVSLGEQQLSHLKIS